MDKEIICIVKGGKIGEKAVKKAIVIAKEESAKLILLFSSDTDYLLSGNFGISSDDIATKGIENIGKTLINQYKDEAEEAGIKVSSKIVEGNLLDELSKMIKRNNNSILLIPKLKRGPIEKFLIGSSIDEYIESLKKEFPSLKIYTLDG